LPKDVTPEEVAAIAAAAAQIQMAGALQDEHRSVESQSVESRVAESQFPKTESQTNRLAGPDRFESSSSASLDVPAENGSGSLVHQTAATDVDDRRSDRCPQFQDEPVTMAATAESVAASAGTSRWTAVPVALAGEEAAVSLDQEMRNAYAAFADPQPEAVPEPEPAVSAEAMKAEAVPVAQSQPPASSFEPASPAPVAAEVAPVEANALASPLPEFAEAKPDPARVAEFMSPVSEAEVAGLAGIVGLGAEVQQPASQSEPAIGEPESKPNSETVKSTAAAWATWRETRDTGKDSGAVQAQPAEFQGPESAPAETARAVAAGAEQASQDIPTAAPSENSTDVASIVDSVLADLRPKLMAEISRKMAEKR